MQKILLVTLLSLAVSATLYSADANDGWLTDFEAAKKAAAEKKLPILADFSGSDWCGWCIKLDKEVFSQKEFKDFAKENLILFMADFPHKSKQNEKIIKQNKELMTKHGVRGFPTVLMMDAEGNVFARTGYEEGGVAAYIVNLKKLMAESKSK